MDCNNIQSNICAICGQKKSIKELTNPEAVRDGILNIIKKSHPEWNGGGLICEADLNVYRSLYIEEALRKQKGEISSLDRRVLKGMREHEIISQNINQAFERQLTLGERVADRVATFGGSWRFIGLFMGIMVLWVIVNSLLLLVAKPFDPYPFILLNLFLSSLAALQAPVIMMSQNRQEDRDRLRAEEDYRINLKAELEIRHINEKLDHLIGKQWQRLLEIQQIQLDLMKDMAKSNDEEE